MEFLKTIKFKYVKEGEYLVNLDEELLKQNFEQKYSDGFAGILTDLSYIQYSNELKIYIEKIIFYSFKQNYKTVLDKSKKWVKITVTYGSQKVVVSIINKHELKGYIFGRLSG
jgi:hypothetical protein